jgi:hypothetical protein
VLGELTRRFAESDVAMMLTLLNAVGLQLRAADPVAMKVSQYSVVCKRCVWQYMAVHRQSCEAVHGGTQA